ncbi:hypothetical protein K7A41_20730 [Sphingobacterium sp. InxBP1]|uniref:hypothetical protein n=1 Tax=Sphingobacterium TaxID=28453 RepID=UPI0022439A34|nr:hypothetical protein [Sphingobacterium sp. InxBP1]MCW8313664.1 hypothetical protein [Sphingobacterium sp. InxBP1]
MKYFMADPVGQPTNELFFELANFLWDNGNDVFIASNIICNCKEIDAKQFDYTVSLVLQHNSIETLFATHHSIICTYFNQVPQNIPALIVANDGIYTDSIPYPYKIFAMEGLNQSTLAQFFDWCRKFNFFI